LRKSASVLPSARDEDKKMRSDKDSIGGNSQCRCACDRWYQLLVKESIDSLAENHSNAPDKKNVKEWLAKFEAGEEQ
jgi:hypothetical protein